MRKAIVITALALAAATVQAKDIVDTAVAAGDFKTLAVALEKAGLIDTLKGKGPFTVFAPTDAAFAKVPKADLDALLADKEKLAAVLTYHVVPGNVMAKDVKAGKVKTVQGSDLTLTTSGGVKVDGANVVKTDIVAEQRRDPRHRQRRAAEIRSRVRTRSLPRAPWTRAAACERGSARHSPRAVAQATLQRGSDHSGLAAVSFSARWCSSPADSPGCARRTT